MQDLNQIAASLTNQDGKDFLHVWNRTRTIIEILFSDGNWFYVRTQEGPVYFLPHGQENGCKAGFFGEKDYFEKYRAGRHVWQQAPPQLEIYLPQPSNI